MRHGAPVHDGVPMTAQASFYTAAAAFFLSVLAGVMESRRNRRGDIDATGWVPWRGLQVTGFFAALACVIFALHA
jgi:hypothetical protein